MKNYILFLFILLAVNSFGQENKSSDGKKFKLKFKKTGKIVRYDFKGYSFYFDEKTFFSVKWIKDTADFDSHLKSVDRASDTILINKYFTDSLIAVHTNKYLKWGFRSIANSSDASFFALKKIGSNSIEKYVVEKQPFLKEKGTYSDKLYYSEQDTLLFALEYYHVQHPIGKPKGYLKYRGPWGVTAGWVYQTYTHNLDLAVKKYSKSFEEGDGWPGLFFSYLNIGAEIWENNKVFIAPKAGFGTTLFILNINVNFIAYNDNFNIWRPAIVPEIGFALPFYNLINVTYG
jgi:hypothetical protein